MKKIFQYLIGTAMLFFVSNAPVAAAGYYMGLQGGVGFLPDAKASDSEGSFNFSYDAGFDGSITLGYDLGDEHPKVGRGRVELEVNTASNDINEAEFVEGKVGVDGSVERISVMLNTIGEYSSGSGMILYVLLGLGWAEVSLDNVSILGESFVDDSNSQLAYQVGLGVGRRLSDHFVIDISYRYYGTTDPEFTKKDGTSLDYEYASHRVLAGLRFYF